MEPQLVLSPAFRSTVSSAMHKLGGAQIKITARSSLVLDGEDIKVSNKRAETRPCRQEETEAEPQQSDPSPSPAMFIPFAPPPRIKRLIKRLSSPALRFLPQLKLLHPHFAWRAISSLAS
eukprot:6203669-Pleurochrysis_carterae.AAC.1